MAKLALNIPTAPTSQTFKLADLIAGDAILTVVAKCNGERFTYRAQRFDFKAPNGQKTGKHGYSVRLLNGPENTRDYVYMGMLDAETGELRQTKASKVGTAAHSWVLFSWLARNLADGKNAQNKCDIYLAGRCLRCGRVLTVPDSIETMYGPDCAGKIFG